MASSSAEAQMKDEIARLTASINLHKKQGYTQPQPKYTAPRSHTYVNPNYKPPSNKYVRPGLTSAHPTPFQAPPTSKPSVPPVSSSNEVKEVVLNGVAFESSGRSLVRKDLPKKPPSSGPPKPMPTVTNPPYVRKSGHLIPAGRVYKPKARRGRNMTLTNNTRPYQARRTVPKRKYSDKPCPRFTTTGSCSRGLTCMYQHDSSKIAICWNFLQDQCPNNAETCALSHDPTPERTPLCVHFLNKGRCTRVNCRYPHVNVGVRQGVCRDFAVLGYCSKGLDCDHQHVRECPDFAEKGECTTKGCKLPHVIRANRNRKLPVATLTTISSSGLSVPPARAAAIGISTSDTDVSSVPEHVSAEDAKLGDEYISLTFNESESSDDDEEEEEEDDEDENEEEEEEGEEEDADDVDNADDHSSGHDDMNE